MLFLQVPSLSTPPLPAKRPVTPQEKRIALRETNAYLKRLGRSERPFEYVERESRRSDAISVTDARGSHMAIIAMSPRPWIVVYSDDAAIRQRMRHPLQGKRVLNDPEMWFRLGESTQRRLWPTMKLGRGWLKFEHHLDQARFPQMADFGNTVTVRLTTPVVAGKAQVCVMIFDDIDRSLIWARTTPAMWRVLPPPPNAVFPKRPTKR